MGTNYPVHLPPTDNVVCVYPALGELLYQPLCLIQGEELRDADADEGGQGRVSELLVDLEKFDKY